MPGARRHHHDQYGRAARRRRARRNRPAGGRVATMIAILVLPAVLAACSDGAELDPGPSAPARLPTSAPTPTASTPAAEGPVITFVQPAQQYAGSSVVAAFIDYRTARFHALVSLDEQRSDLAATATGAQLAHDREVIADRKAKGYRLEGRPKWAVVAVRGEGEGRGEVDACEWDSASWVVDRDGNIVTPVSDKWLPVRTVIVRESGGYRVSESLTGDFDCGGAT